MYKYYVINYVKTFLLHSNLTEIVFRFFDNIVQLLFFYICKITGFSVVQIYSSELNRRINHVNFCDRKVLGINTLFENIDLFHLYQTCSALEEPMKHHTT